MTESQKSLLTKAQKRGIKIVGLVKPVVLHISLARIRANVITCLCGSVLCHPVEEKDRSWRGLKHMAKSVFVRNVDGLLAKVVRTNRSVAGARMN
jgi:hypothetical protein